LASTFAVDANAAHYVVRISNMKFGPAPKNLKVGDTIEWENVDMFRHTATAKGLFDADLNPGTKQTVTLDKTGIVSVVCRYHPNMTLKLTVGEK
jgi:plastocyanin